MTATTLHRATATATATATSVTRGTARSRTRRVRLAAVGGNVLATSLTYLVAHAAGTDFALTDPGKTETHALTLPEIAVFAGVFSLLGWGVLALLERRTRHARTVWTVLAGAVLALSFVPIAVEQASADTKVMLAVIHVMVAAVLVPVLRRSSATRTVAG